MQAQLLQKACAIRGTAPQDRKKEVRRPNEVGPTVA